MTGVQTCALPIYKELMYPYAMPFIAHRRKCLRWSQEQFPLVQRQWDTVSQFRAQITYKATLSLRDSGASLEVRRSHMLVLAFWPTLASGCLLYSVDDPSSRISATDRRIVNISHATSKDLTINLIAKPKICTQWVFTERQCLVEI